MSVYITRLQKLHNAYISRSLLPVLLRNLSSHPLPLLRYLDVQCDGDRDVRALTKSLPLCTNLRTLYYERGFQSVPSERVEQKMWKTAVRRCKNLEIVRVAKNNIGLVSVLKELSKKEGIQALKLRKILRVDWYTGRVLEDYTAQVKYLLPALQQH